MRYVYMLRCKDKTLYTGITNDLEKRVFDHNNSKCWARYTKSRRPVKLVRSKRVKDRVTAMKLEYATKRIGKEQKEELVKKSATRAKRSATKARSPRAKK